MITAHVERFGDSLEELKVLFPRHWEELALDQEKVPLDPQYEVYLEREAAGGLVFVTLREQGALVGYFVGFVSPGLHYRTCLTCQMDVFYVRQDKRAGHAGLTLFREVERELRRRRVQRWFVGEKLHHGAAALFKRLEFQPIERYHSKWIGD